MEFKCSFDLKLLYFADTTPPTFLDCPVTHPVIFAAPGQTRALVNWTVPTAVDNTGIAPAVTAAEGNLGPPGNQLEQGIHRFEYTATDSAGNIGKCTFHNLIQGKCLCYNCLNNLILGSGFTAPASNVDQGINGFPSCRGCNDWRFSAC